jgi:hypothetical protein
MVAGVLVRLTVVIGVSSNMNLTVTATDVLCNGDSTGTAQVFVNGGTIPYSYFWSNVQQQLRLPV